jgi:hypothetical protein
MVLGNADAISGKLTTPTAAKIPKVRKPAANNLANRIVCPPINSPRVDKNAVE